MILSASRRTDLPAFYPAWFMNRIREGFVLVPNPYNSRRLSRIELSSDIVDCIVFWSKNPRPMLTSLPQLHEMGYKFYFEYTLTAYSNDIELFVPSIEQRLDTFRTLSSMLGADQTDWRYDPILINSKYTVFYHLEQFEKICRELDSYTKRCIISFVDPYAHLGSAFSNVPVQDMHRLAGGLSAIARKYSISLYACAESADFSEYGILPSACIDKTKIEALIGSAIHTRKDPGQRTACGCMESIDIGAYDTCVHGCQYCYATKNISRARRRFQKHHPESPLLTGWPNASETVSMRSVESQRDPQTHL